MKDLLYIPVVFTIWILIGCDAKNEAKKAIPSKDYQWGAYYDDYFPDKRDSAFYLLNRVVNNSEDSSEKADAYFRMGRQQLFAGDHYSAQASFLSSIKTLDENDTAHYNTLAADYNALGNAALEVKDYQPAIDNYRLASKFATNDDHKLYILNNLGVAYQKQGNYKKSASVFDSAANNNTLDTSIKAKIISNFARTKWLADSAYNPLSEFMYALTLRLLKNDSVAINASFAYLSDYYEKTRPDSAYYYALKRLEVAKKLDDPGERLEAFNQLIKVGPINQTKQYSDQYIQLNDSITNARSKDRNQFALIRVGAEKSKADNLQLQKHVSNQRLTIWGTVLLAILAIIALVVRARIRRNKLKQESENAIRNARLKTSQKVHDVVANGLYVIMNELEHNKTIDKEPLIARIEGLYEKSRNISYEEDSSGSNVDYDGQIHDLFNDFTNDETDVIAVGNQQTFWNRITEAKKNELLLVLNEIMVNMKKHSGANSVVIQFKQENNKGFICYNDNGCGFPSGFEFGNGLKNTVSRIKSLNGEVIFGKSEKDGASITISFPLESDKL